MKIFSSLIFFFVFAPVCASAQPWETDRLQIDTIGAYDLIWTDSGSGAKEDGSFWRPTPAPFWHQLGSHAKLGHGFPREQTIVVKELVPGSLAPPVDYDLVWTDAGSGAKADVSVWRPRCGAGYSALGDVANNSHAKPGVDEVMCVSDTLLGPAQEGSAIWNDAGSGAKSDFGSWGISGYTEGGIDYTTTGLFYGAPTHSRPDVNDAKVMWSIQIPSN